MHHEIHHDDFDNLVKETSQLLNAAKWAEALSKFHQIADSKRRMAFFYVAEKVGLAAYTFCFFALSSEKSESAQLFWHKMAFSVVKEAVQHLAGREQAAFFHICAAKEIAANDEEVLENYLSFFPVGLISKDDAIETAKKVITFSPVNSIASDLLK